MKPFSRNEIISVSLILLIISGVTFFNLQISLRRARDVQRRADISTIHEALLAYQSDFGFFPPATADGKILACKADNFDEIVAKLKDVEEDRFNILRQGLRGCNWGEDAFRDVTDDSYPPYLEKLPADPKTGEGLTYLYLSDMKLFQLYAHLEGGSSEEGYRQGIVERGLSCGTAICNFGKAYGDTPLEMSIEMYENKLNLKTQN
jgi:type II secretory pathway pseudopilin PulG